MMSLWLIVPRDPPIFRDGKPFTATPGERSTSLAFPQPSTLAGAVRTRVGTDPATGDFVTARANELKQLASRGPLLVKLDKNGRIAEWFFPSPADALLIESRATGQVSRHRLVPLEIPEGASTNLKGLKPVGPVTILKDKPAAHPPRYWSWKSVQEWLEKPAGGPMPAGLGIHGPERENRTHVSIAPNTQTGIPGALFQTSGMEFIHLERESEETPRLANTRSLALALETEAGMIEGLGFLGGERRTVHWQAGEDHFPSVLRKSGKASWKRLPAGSFWRLRRTSLKGIFRASG